MEIHNTHLLLDVPTLKSFLKIDHDDDNDWLHYCIAAVSWNLHNKTRAPLIAPEGYVYAPARLACLKECMFTFEQRHTPRRYADTDHHWDGGALMYRTVQFLKGTGLKPRARA